MYTTYTCTYVPTYTSDVLTYVEKSIRRLQLTETSQDEVSVVATYKVRETSLPRPPSVKSHVVTHVRPLTRGVEQRIHRTCHACRPRLLFYSGPTLGLTPCTTKGEGRNPHRHPSRDREPLSRVGPRNVEDLDDKVPLLKEGVSGGG